MSHAKIHFRPFATSDCEALRRLADNPRVSANLRDQFPSPYTRADAELWIDLNLKRSTQTSMAITVGGEFAGGIGIVLGDDIHRYSAEIGYWLGESYWGQGIVTSCLIDFCPWVFDNFNVNRLFAGVFDNNPGSARVLEKAGFEYEGRLRSAVTKRGRTFDELLYAKIRPNRTSPND